MAEVQEAQGGMDKVDANALQVRVELQADCLAGVWANRAQAKWHFIEPGDVEAALQTATAIGDDRLQRRTQGYVVPDAFTHGTSARRPLVSAGLKSGQVASCDTFAPSRFEETVIVGTAEPANVNRRSRRRMLAVRRRC